MIYSSNIPIGQVNFQTTLISSSQIQNCQENKWTNLEKTKK